MKILRTPDERFQNLPEFNFEPRYVEVNGLRMHYIEQGTGDPILCLHGEPSWCFLYRKMLPILAEAGRAIAPDLIGFGRSDKPASKDDYTYAFHYAQVEGFVNALDLKRITLICQDWGGLLGLPVAANNPDRFARLVIMNTGLPTGDNWTPGFMAWRKAAEKMADMDVGRVIRGACVSALPPEVIAAYDAPFPDVTYKMGAHKFPLLVPIAPDDPTAKVMRETREKFKQWSKPALVMFSDKDPVTAGGDKGFRKNIPSTVNEPEITIRNAGHFLQEDKGEEIARHVVDFIRRNPF